MEDKFLDRLRRLNRSIALMTGALLFGCAAIVLIDVVLRQTGSSLGGTDEISGYVMAIATSWGMAFTLLELGHVRIDVLRGRAGPHGRAVFDLLAMLALTGTVSLIAFKCWPVLDRSLANASRANTPLETPLAWVQIPWFAGWIWFAVMAWLIFIAAALLVIKGQFEKAETAVGAFGDEDAFK